MEITKLKQRVKKLERRNKVKVLKLRRLQKVGTGQRVETANDTVMDDVSNQGRMIAEMDQDADVVLEEAKEVADDAKADQDTKVVDVVTTTKLITKVVTTASTTITATEVLVPAATTAAASKLIVAPSRRTKGGKGILVEEPKPLKKQAQIKQDHQYARELKNVAGFKMDYFNGMSYNDIYLIFEAKFNTNVAFLQNTKEQINEEESRALKKINETPAERAAKRNKLDEEMEELKRHL
uniref:Uncharacterized protein n=1 Tax=Tanacetum cinerariifolium TaxID=118510 RepID=A0A6L2P1L0_TANCI|nr:hypothetical protein [Tanacetum cinerariifolium]